MIETVAQTMLPVDEKLIIQRNRIRNGKSNKRLSVVTAIHGDELEGQYVAFLVAKRLNESLDLLDGIVDIYPGMNPLGIDTISRGIPAFDLDMNRIFPGRRDGDMNEYIASRIISSLSGSDLVIDIHASNIFLTEVPQIRINEVSKARLVPLAMEANVNFVWVHQNATVLESTLAYSLNNIGTDTLVVEMGVGMRITKKYGEMMADGIFSLLKKLGMWKGEVGAISKPVVSERNEDVTFINAPSAGIFIQSAKHGAILKEGDEVGAIVNPLSGDVITEVKAPKAGWLFTIREYPVLDNGSLIARILSLTEEDKKLVEAFS